MSDPVRLRRRLADAQLGAPLRRLRRAAPGLDGRGGRRGLAHRSLVPARDRARSSSSRPSSPAGTSARSPAALLRRAKATGLTDARIAGLLDCARGGRCARAARAARHRAGSTSASTPAPPSSRPRRPTSTRPSAHEDESEPDDRPKVVILGSGPNRIGQGIEFDYCCVHAAFALREAGLRDDHGQLQPGDGVDRLRHLRPPLLRAADARARAGGRRARAAARA